MRIRHGLKKPLDGGMSKSLQLSCYKITLLLVISSQVPGLHRRSGSKKKTRTHSASKTGPSPAQRIAAQLASRAPNPPIAVSQRQSPPQHDDESQYEIVPPNNLNQPVEDLDWSDIVDMVDDALDGYGSDSSTEPESADEDAHRRWERRQQRRQQRKEQRKERNRQEMDHMEDTWSHGQRQEHELDDHHHDTQWPGDEHEHRRHCTGVHKQGAPGDPEGHEIVSSNNLE